ncbi:MAG: hypothetical protein R3F33_08670 [Planctomycetota bacterium]
MIGIDLPTAPRRGGARPLTLLILAALAGVLLWGWQKGKQSKPSGPAVSEDPLKSDRRVSELLQDCGIGLPFEGDTTDLVPVMAGKLVIGQGEVLHRYKELLGQRGTAVVPVLERLFEQQFGERFGTPVLLNVLNVAALMPAGAGLGIARKGFDHPRDDVRMAALDVFAVHGEPEDFDRILPWIPRIVNQPSAGDYLRALAYCDPERFHENALEWMEAGQYLNTWAQLATLVGGDTDPDRARRYMAIGLGETAPQPARAALMVPAARLGIEEALLELSTRMASDIDQRARLALDAVQVAGRYELAEQALMTDKRPEMRQYAAQILAANSGGELVRAQLTTGLSDSVAAVRLACLEGLVMLGDTEALARTLVDLRGTPVERGQAFEILAHHWDLDPSLPQKVFDIFSGLYAQADGREGKLDILKHMGRVPLGASAEFLFAHYAELTGPVGGLTPHRWAAGHAFNAGPAGMAVLQARLAQETDPEKRLDLIGMIWQDKSEGSKDILLALVQDETRNPYERLFVADCLTRLTQPEELAPILKRVYQQSTHRDLRPALQCMLWKWFALPPV